jgi:RNA polymerase sigma-70 factor (ECF subfamily)
MNPPPGIVILDGEPGDASPAAPVPDRHFNVVPALPYGGGYPSNPQYKTSPLYSGRPLRFRGPHGETFETDGMHLWRIDPSADAYRTPGGYPIVPPGGYHVARPATIPIDPSIGDSESAKNSSQDAPVESSQDETGELLQHDYGKSAGKRSIAGSGHAVRFETPSDDRLLTSVRIFGSRYGLPQAPNEDFHVWLCDEAMHSLAQFDFPYAKFERGDPAWVTLKIKPTTVPKKFVLCIGFNPEQTKGVYVHYDDRPAENSLTGLPGQEPKVFSTGNWMIRVTLARPKVDRVE